MYRRLTAAGFLLSACTSIGLAQQIPVPHDVGGIKYVRDAEEYAVLTRQVYRIAAEQVRRGTEALGRTPWAVVLDVDETALDNSTYQLEREAYGMPFDSASWDAWVVRREAGAVPGVLDFVRAVRSAGGHIAWITNRSTRVMAETQANLAAENLWSDDDRLCTQDSSERPKRVRRAEVIAGTGACSWSGVPMKVVAFVGDQMGDFPVADEHIPDTGSDDAFGRTCFVLPNPTYGEWTTRVTRARRPLDR